MSIEIKVPAAGESVTEAIIGEWIKKSGDYVERDEAVLVLETDKASMEVVAEASGRLEVKAQEGETVPVGAIIGVIDTSAAKPTRAPAGASAAAPSGPPKSPPPPATPPPSSARPAPVQAAPQSGGQGGAVEALSPAVRRLVGEHDLDVSQLDGTGRGGRVTKGDVLQALDSTPKKPAPAPETQRAPGRNGHEPREERVAMTTIRKRIAERLVQAQQQAAILTTFNEVDMSQAMALRSQYKDQFEKKYGVKLGFMGLFVKACVEALREYRAVNASLDGTDIIYHNYYNIGVAVSTPKGLMVPVIHDADQLSLAEIEMAIRDYAIKARDGKISIDDLSGGTFTISNGGVFGSLMSTPILNPPQTGILGMHKIEDRPVVVDKQVVVRPMMYLALSYDHRLIDGRESVSFLVRVKECIEDPQRILLEV